MRDTHELDRQKKWDGDVKSPGKVKKRDNTMEVGRKGWETVNIEKRKGWETVNISGASNLARRQNSAHMCPTCGKPKLI